MISFGVGLFPTGAAKDMVRRAILAEELGFDFFWVADTHLIWREAWVLLGAMAAQTSRIQLGPGVTHPIVRHPSAIAAAAATLAELAPGRINIGLGVGDSGPANMGLRRASLAELESAVATIAAMLRGDDTPLRLSYAPRQALPVYVAGASDRTHRMSGRIAAGALVAGALDELTGSVTAIREGEREAGRRTGEVQVAVFTTACIDEDEERARQAVRAVVARKAIISLGRAERLGILGAEDREPLRQLRTAYDTHHHMEPRYNELVPDRWVERFSMAGSGRLVLARCRQLAQDGADQVAVVFNGLDLDAQMQAFAQAVIVPMRQSAGLA